MTCAASVDAAKLPPAGGTANLRLMAVLATLMGFGSISTDLYLPAMPSMATDLGGGHGALELTIATYLVGFSLGQLVWGPISDSWGRRLPVAVGIVLFMLGSAGCALSGTVDQVIAWRVVQAIGASAGVVLSRAMVRDLFEGKTAAQRLSTLITVMAVAPLIGPFVGGQILAAGSWRLIFALLVAIGAATLAALFTVPETLPPQQRDAAALSQSFSRYAVLLREPRVLAAAGIGGAFYAGVYAYIAASPAAFITYYHVSPQLYGVLFGSAIAAIMAANQLNTRLLNHFGMDRLLRWGAVLTAVFGSLAAINGYTNFGGLVGLALPLIAFSAMNGLIVANSLAGVLNAFPNRAGAVSALVGALQYGGGILGSSLVGLMSDGTPAPLGFMMAISGLVCAAFTPLLPRSERSKI